MSNAILLIFCPDQRGITAAVTDFIFKHNGNIINADQHTDKYTNQFFMRVEWELEGFSLDKKAFGEAFDQLARQFQMTWTLDFTEHQKRMAIFVSKHLHCLYDLLFRFKSGHFECSIPLIISNHEEGKTIASQFNIDYHHFFISAENKFQQEREQLELLKKYQIDTVVLARYHQILSPEFIKHFPNQIINIHHSFLPAFVGQKPYEQAYRKGVKIIGATSHYVTQDLDQGPIIEQDTVRISHKDSVEDLVRKGEDLEKIVLSRAVRWHLERKILSYENKTVIFD